MLDFIHICIYSKIHAIDCILKYASSSLESLNLSVVLGFLQKGDRFELSVLRLFSHFGIYLVPTVVLIPPRAAVKIFTR